MACTVYVSLVRLPLTEAACFLISRRLTEGRSGLQRTLWEFALERRTRMAFGTSLKQLERENFSSTLCFPTQHIYLGTKIILLTKQRPLCIGDKVTDDSLCNPLRRPVRVHHISVQHDVLCRLSSKWSYAVRLHGEMLR